jgi:acyl dehydratase
MSTMNEISTLEQLKASVGQQIGLGEWFELTQERVNAFADATGDHQWIHVDVERARASSFGTTIAHGLLLLSTVSLTRGYQVSIPMKWGFNYGYDRVRFPSSAPVGSRIRLRSSVVAVTEPAPGQVQFVAEPVAEVEGSSKPALVAQQTVRYYLETE